MWIEAVGFLLLWLHSNWNLLCFLLGMCAVWIYDMSIQAPSFSQEFQLGKCQLQLRSQKTISTWRPGSRTMIRRSRKWSVNIHQWHPRFWAPWGMLALPHPTFLHLHSWQLSRRKVWLWSTTAVGIFLGMNHRNISLRCLGSTGVS